MANIERAQFWAQVLQIPGMQVVKSDIYESLGIAMPAQGDEVLSTPAPQENALEKAMQGFGQGKQDVEPDKGRKDETALAARAKEGEPKGIAGWLAPLKKKLLEAKKNGAGFDQLKQMMLEARLNTHALAGAMSDNIRKGFYGDEDEEELEAANKRLVNPIPQSDGTKCYTENCKRHKGTTREGETLALPKNKAKVKDRGSIIYKDERCSVIQYKDGRIEVHAHFPITNEEDAVKALKSIISRCREKKKGRCVVR